MNIRIIYSPGKYSLTLDSTRCLFVACSWFLFIFIFTVTSHLFGENLAKVMRLFNEIACANIWYLLWSRLQHAPVSPWILLPVWMPDLMTGVSGGRQQPPQKNATEYHRADVPLDSNDYCLHGGPWINCLYKGPKNNVTNWLSFFCHRIELWIISFQIKLVRNDIAFHCCRDLTSVG